MKYIESYGLWRKILVAMLVPLAFIAFWPSPVDQPVQGDLARILHFLHDHGIPSWFNYQFVEASANVMLFVPLGAVSSLAFAEKQWWQIGALGLLVSGLIELGQQLFLHNRFASPLDIVTNTAGAVIGALLALTTLKRLQARSLSATGL
ncbi:VanZ family protein [Pseudarthrobacter sulfonivorans]|uniref:VanZ family protein n=1 Tax=Pseudarthrobacter sulfonivorans TaxID=121292 RepID=UPI0021063A85|nr:VanZ family protein [Pseudarthrobacter sulfonivorans]